MTDNLPLMEFFRRLKRIEKERLVLRDVFVLWAIDRRGGMAGLELAKSLGYEGRSHVQNCIARLIDAGLIEDRRVRRDRRTPNVLYILPAGQAFLAEVVPA